MRSLSVGVLIPFLVLSTPLWAQQPTSTATVSASDPQAIAVVQAAITALGGATAISQAQTWTFQAQITGSFGSDVTSYVMSTDTDRSSVLPNGTVTQMPMTQSHFVPALVASILLTESQSPQFRMAYIGTSTADSKTTTVIALEVGPEQVPVQTWAFDSGNLPVQINFQLPAEVGTKKTVHGNIALSDYRSISGVLYPFKIVEFSHHGLPEIITLQSIVSGATAVPADPDASAGDSR
jgi:hypothetical protein